MQGKLCTLLGRASDLFAHEIHIKVNHIGVSSIESRRLKLSQQSRFACSSASIFNADAFHMAAIIFVGRLALLVHTPTGQNG